jgi:uncharacterized protein (TIGR02996 family)
MSRDEAFLRDIIDHPDDDALRLIYADWLDDHGEPRRAEFIRLQCRLAGLPEDDAERPDLLDREWELLTVYRGRWQPAATSLIANNLWDSGFRRGFFARVHLPASLLLEHGAELAAACPLEEVCVEEAGGRLGEILRQPWLARVASLDLTRNALTAEDVQALFDSADLGRLRRLVLRSVRLRPGDVERLARWPGLSRLEHLDLGTDWFSDQEDDRGNQLGPNWLRLLLESPRLERLTSLDLHNNELTEADVALLANTPRLASLRSLQLDCCNLAPICLAVLGTAQGLPALRHLTVNGSTFGDEGLATLVGSPLPARLDSLDLSMTPFGPQAAAALAASPHLGRLRRLDLLDCYREPGFGPRAAKALASARFASLAALGLANNRILLEGMTALANSPVLTTLTELDLTQTSIGPEGVRVLANSPTFANLRALNLNYNGIGRDGAKALADSPVLSRLRHLSVVSANLGGPGARALLMSSRLSGLRRLDLWENGVTDGTIRQIVDSTPLTELRWLGLSGNSRLTREGQSLLAASPRLPWLLRLEGGSWKPHEQDRPVSPVLLEHGKGREL